MASVLNMPIALKINKNEPEITRSLGRKREEEI